jgi:hypothetical protein
MQSGARGHILHAESASSTAEFRTPETLSDECKSLQYFRSARDDRENNSPNSLPPTVHKSSSALWKLRGPSLESTHVINV